MFYFQVRILINQTKLLPVNLRTDLLMIRFASMNQILDPWVYILLRREIVWKVVSTLKKIFCCKSDEDLTQDLENQRQSGFVSPSATSTSSETPTCCAFCWHCMFDPPQSVRQSSISNFYNDFSRKSLSHRSPTRKHLIDLVETATNPGSSASASLEQSPVFKLKNIEHLKEKASTDLTLTQPLSIHGGKTKGILKNGNIRACNSDSQLCTKLLDHQPDDQPNAVQNGKLI